MFKASVARQAVRAINRATSRPAARAAASRPALTIPASRSISSTPVLSKDNSEKKDPALRATGASGQHEGEYARTDESVKIEYPRAEEVPRSPIVQGRGGMHFKRTLASFSLENKVTVITGGARGLGLVMGQAVVASGSDLAIVDLNSKFYAAVALPARREQGFLTSSRGRSRRAGKEACCPVQGGEPWIGGGGVSLIEHY